MSWNYTTWLNIVVLILAAALIARFARTGGGRMPRTMGGAPEWQGAESGHANHDIRGVTAGAGALSGAGDELQEPAPTRRGGVRDASGVSRRAGRVLRGPGRGAM